MNRGWIGENEELTKTNANKVAKNYKDKFQIDNNIKVEFVDGLKVAGQEVEGNTSATSFLGKTAKNKQNAIDKKALQVQKLQDKVTMLEGGNAPVMETLDAAKEELRIAQNELKELQNTAKRKNLKPNITIQIDKNAKNPYATLRAELEHARDIAKGEVPKEKGKHFSRYEGVNEAEVAPSYTYKKSVGRTKTKELEQYKPISQDELNNYQTTTMKDTDFGISDPDMLEEGYEPYTIHNIKNSDGKVLAHLRITNGNYIAWRENKGIEKGAARKLIAKLLYDNKYQSLVWDATTKNSVKSYERFCNEFPDLVDRIQFTDKYNKVDINIPSNYTQEKGVLNEGSKSNNTISKRGQVLSGDVATVNKQEVSTVSPNEGTNRTDKSGILSKSNSTTNERGSITDTNNETRLQTSDGQSTQLKLDFSQATTEVKSAEEMVDAVTTGKVRIETPQDVSIMINKGVELDPKISGTTWEAICKDAEATADLMINAERLGLDSELKEAISLNDVTTLDKITRKVLAAQELSSHLAEKLATLGENPPMETMESVIDLIQQIRLYTKETGSASGRMLQARKLVNRAVETFGSLRLSELTQSGISELADLLQMEINKIDLNFTRGSLVEKKQALISNRYSEQLSTSFNMAVNNNFISKKLVKQGQNLKL